MNDSRVDSFFIWRKNEAETLHVQLSASSTSECVVLAKTESWLE